MPVNGVACSGIRKGLTQVKTRQSPAAALAAARVVVGVRSRKAVLICATNLTAIGVYMRLRVVQLV